MLRFVIDTHVIDAMLDDRTLFEAVQQAIVDSRIEVHVTHVQIDEVMAIPDEKSEKRSELANLLANSAAQRSPTYGFILGKSRLGEAMLSDDGFAATYEAELSKHKSQGNDAVLIATAWNLGGRFVTEDAGARKTADRMGMQCCCTIADFRTALG